MNPVSTLCIPRMESFFKINYVTDKIIGLKIGTIESIKEMPWNEEPKTENIKSRLIKNECIKIVHDGKWYWKLLLAKFS